MVWCGVVLIPPLTVQLEVKGSLGAPLFENNRNKRTRNKRFSLSYEKQLIFVCLLLFVLGTLSYSLITTF